MKRPLFIGTLLMMMALIILSFTHRPESEVSNDYISKRYDNQDWNECVTKAKSEWGGTCLNYGFSELKYTVHLVNTCSEMVDLMSCVQRDNGRWQCFYRLDMKQSDTLNAYACRGNGKFLKWVRKAGDFTTKFPTLAEVNDQY
jgi:hypothetical protein